MSLEFLPLKQLLDDTRCKNSNWYIFICYSTYSFVYYPGKRNSVHILLADYSPHQIHSEYNHPNQPSPPAAILFPFEQIFRLCWGGNA